MAKKKNTNKFFIEDMSAKFRTTFVHVFEPQEEDDKPEDQWKFQLTALFDPKADAAYIKLVKTNCAKLACKIFECKNVAELDAESIRWNPFLTATPKQIEKWGDAYEGKVFLRLKTKFKPQIVSMDGKSRIIDDDDTSTGFYPGCWARMAVTVGQTYDFKGKQGVSVYLSNLQKTKNDEPLMGGDNVEEQFESLEEEEDTGVDEFGIDEDIEVGGDEDPFN